MMSREDMLRELELLPVWQGRQVAPQVNTEKKQEEQLTVEPSDVIQAEKSEVIAKKTSQFRLVVSADAQWVFVLEPHHSNEAEELLQNMLKAVSVKVGHDIADANIEYLNQQSPKVIVVMGESEAQQLLNTQQALEEIRGKERQFQHISVIVTYAPSYLLKHLADKAKAWEDLCLARLTMTAVVNA